MNCFFEIWNVVMSQYMPHFAVVGRALGANLGVRDDFCFKEIVPIFKRRHKPYDRHTNTHI